MPESTEHDDDLLERLGALVRDETTGENHGRDDEMEALLNPPRGRARDSLLDGFEQRLKSASPQTPENAESDAGRVVELASATPKRGGGMIAGLAVVVALAAALLLWLLVPSADDVGVGTEYTVASFQAGRAEQRAEPTDVGATIRTTPDDPFRAVLSPASAVSTSVALAVIARPAGGAGICARPTTGVDISDVGAVKIDGTLDQFATVTPGQWQLELWIGAPGSLPADGATGVQEAPAAVHVTAVALEVLSTP